MRLLRTIFVNVDIWLISAIFFLSLLGLSTMYTFGGDNSYFDRQTIWIAIAVIAFVLGTIPDYRFLRTGNTAFFLYVIVIIMLGFVLVLGATVKGAQTHFRLFAFSLQPSDPAKLILIALLAKYFSKRHEHIGDFRHIIISGAYAFVLFVLVFVQPDLGSGTILFLIWFGMVLVAGIKFRHLALVITVIALTFTMLWNFGFHEYQKARIRNFIHPLADIRGTGYNAYQSMIAVGSGQIWGKGVGYGTQSKLQFLPEFETDFIFASFAEEWGLVGSLMLFGLFGVVIWRLLYHATRGATNFERLFATGVAIYFTSQFLVHVGMNIGLMPVTGTTVPFLSYGGSHLLTEYLAVGMVIAMGKYTKTHYTSDDLVLASKEESKS